eukprot:1884364-Prymnesium_polylepis.1
MCHQCRGAIGERMAGGDRQRQLAIGTTVVGERAAPEKQSDDLHTVVSARETQCRPHAIAGASIRRVSHIQQPVQLCDVAVAHRQHELITTRDQSRVRLRLCFLQ